MPTTTAQERYALFAILAIAAIGFLLPPVLQPEDYHHFADQRAWLGIPHFADVVTNLIFAVVGVVGVWRIAVQPSKLLGTRLPLTVFFIGLALTAGGSAYYHVAPDTQTIVLDRLPMVIAFAGVIGAFLAQRVSARMGTVGVVAGLAVGGAGIAASVMTGNLALYLALQFGGLVGLVAGLLLLKDPKDPLPWWTLIGWYVVAKALELGDYQVWEMTHHVVSGHALKHLAAGMSGVVLLRAITTLGVAAAPSPEPAKSA